MILTLQTSTFSAYGGIPTYNRLVCRSLNEVDFAADRHVLIATDDPADVSRRSADLPDLKFKAYGRRRMAFVRQVLSLAINHRIDLALIGHVNYAPLGLLLRRLQPQIRYGVMMYGVDVWTRLSRARWLALQQADFAISISEYTKQRAVEVNGVVEARVHLLPNALEVAPVDSLVNAHGTAHTQGLNLLSVCRLDSAERYKGVDTVIESLPLIARRVPEVRYVVVGSGTDLGRLKELAARVGVSDRVIFKGSVDEVSLRICYQTCDVFVLPSAGEGFGFVFLEAMQYGKPVVAADSGGTPEVVQDGVTGTLVPYGDVGELAQALTTLCLCPEVRTRQGQAGYSRLKEHFTFPQFNRTLSEIILRELPPVSLYTARQRAVTC